MNDKIIWGFLLSKLKNEYGVAGLMGNLYVESKLNPLLLQGTYAKKWGITSEEYVSAIDNGGYESFVHDGAGFGLAQWTYWSRKEALISYAKKCGASIGDLSMQLNFLWLELQKYKTVISVLTSTNSVREASDIVVEKYERPKDQSEAAKQNRANFAQKFFDSFCVQHEDPNKTYVQITDKNVNIRAGNDTKYAKFGQEQIGKKFEWVATSENNWHAIVYNGKVGWVSGEYSVLQK